MSRPSSLTGIERTFGDDEIIVSKTDCRGLIQYANRVFTRISGFAESELLGKPHSIVRHPDMPRAVFKFLWDTIADGQEVFAYVLNRCKNGDEYWVFAHVTPSFDPAGNIVGYHSNRRSPERRKIEKIKPLYADLLRAELAAGHNPKDQLAVSMPMLSAALEQLKMPYDEFVFSL